MRQPARVLLATVCVACLPSLAIAKVHITVDLNHQTMHVESKDHVYDWRISSGKRGYDTPPGTYGVLWTDKDHLSDEYNQTPMPNAIFFKPGFAIHGALRSEWGHPASHGCVRLPVAKSAILFGLVQAEGAQIEIVGGRPATYEANASRPRPQIDRAGYGTARGDDAYAAAPRYVDAPVEAAPPQPAPGLGSIFGGVY